MSSHERPAGQPRPYRERLVPSAPVYLVVAVLGVSAALLVLPFSTPGAVAAGVAVTAALVVALVAGSPVVKVEVPGGDPAAAELHAGRARIPVSLLGRTEVLDADGVRRVMGTDADARAWVCHRPWVRTALRTEVVDPRDPTPYWLVSTRRPDQLHAALGGASSGGQAAHSEQIS
ncbi:DUF3093 domain-containing protein [Georgenia sp. 10Sc9-8]|uniref:DUF3093 domain-containing protein n=1 Tax=Georgenia halotolerans TaxID=3028317 RepID=A0ABT5U1K4_9MICO|nr:DUF3093 domain-containing protein [Georgenia halotolerans]